MKSKKVKLIVLFSILAIAVSALAVGNLMARPSSQTAGSVTISGGAVAGTFFSDKAGFNVVTVKVVDADLSPQRVGSARFTGLATTFGDGAAPFNLTSAAAIIGGEKEATKKFTGDGSSKVFPLKTVELTANSIVNFDANAAGTTGGISVLALGRTAIDRNGDGVITAADVNTGNSVSNTVDTVTQVTVSSTPNTTADSVTIVSLAANSADSVTILPAEGGTIRVDLSAKPVDRDGDFVFTATGDLVSVTVRSGDNTALPFAITGDSPGVANGGSFIINIDPVNCGAGAAGCTTITTTYLRYNSVQVAATILTIATALSVEEANSAWGPNKLPRDSGIGLATPAKDGAYNGDDFVLVVDNVTVPVGSYTFDFSTKLVTITTGPTPNAAANSVSIRYQYSEYDTATPAYTPISLVGSTVKVGATLAGAASAKTIDTINNTAGTIALGSNVGENPAAVISFIYDVKESVKKVAKVSTPTSDVQNKSRELTGVESSATSNSFSFKVALFTLADLTKIDTAAAKAGVTTIALLTADAGIGTALDTKINAAAVGLGLSGGSTDGSLLALIMPVADGETLTASYTDADPAATKTDLAVIDLTAPKITLVRPAASFGKEQSQTFEVEVQDAAGGVAAASGLATTDINSLVTQFESNASAVNTVVPIQQVTANTFRLTFSQNFTLEGKVRFWAPVQDKVGNVTTFTGTSAVKGAGDPANKATRPASPFAFTIDNVAPTLASTNPVKSGGKLDVRLATPPSGTHTPTTPTGDSTTILTDSDASFITAGVAVGDKVDNLTDKSSGTITARTPTTVTVGSLTAGTDNKWQNGDAYSISNPGLNNVIDSATARNNVRVNFDLGNGGAGLATVNAVGTDFALKVGTTPLTITKAEIGTNGKGVLLTVLEELATDATPSFEIVSTAIADKAGNLAKKTTTAVTAKDGLAPAFTVIVTGREGVASRAISREEITIDVTTTENVSFPSGGSTARYLRDDNDGDNTLEEAANFATKNLTFTSQGSNLWRATLKIGDITAAKTQQSGAVNIQIKAQDANLNSTTAGKSNPDGTKLVDGKSVLNSAAIVVELDNELNNGAAIVFAMSPLVTGKTDQTDVSNPTIEITFSGEASEYEGTGLRILTADLGAALDSHDTVTITSAVLTMPDASTVDVIANTKSSTATKWIYASSGLALGSYTLTIQASDDVGNTDLTPGGTVVDSLTFKFKVVEPAAFKRELRPGLNMVSLPADPDKTGINDVFGGLTGVTTVATYDPNDALGPWLVATPDATGDFTGTLTTIDSGRAYLVNSTSIVSLSVTIRPSFELGQLPPTISVGVGWNLIPILDVRVPKALTVITSDNYLSGIDWSAALTWDPQNNKFIRVIKGGNLEVGRGYFLWANKAGVIVP